MGTSPSAGFIRLVPGFTAAAGSTFTAKINSAYFTDAAAAGGRVGSTDELASFESEDCSSVAAADDS